MTINMNMSNPIGISQNPNPSLNNISLNSRISIETLPENYESSSSSETDTDEDDDEFINNSKFSIQPTHGSNLSFHNGNIILDNGNIIEKQPGPKIGSVCVQNATDVTFGNKTLYEGPVIIKQMTVKDVPEQETPPRKPNEQPVPIFCINYKFYISLIIVIILLLIAAILMLTIPRKSKPYTPRHLAWDYPPINTSILEDHGVELVQRIDWNANGPEILPEEFKLPLNNVVIAHTGRESCFSRSSCVFIINSIQQVHLANNWDDIGYNFILGGDGRVYVGRGWDYKGAHTLAKKQNHLSVGIAFIGDFTDDYPSNVQFNALKWLLEDGVRLGKLSKDYAIYPQKCFFPTQSPGNKVIDEIKNWDHYFTQYSKYIDVCTFPVEELAKN